MKHYKGDSKSISKIVALKSVFFQIFFNIAIVKEISNNFYKDKKTFT